MQMVFSIKFTQRVTILKTVSNLEVTLTRGPEGHEALT